MHALAPVNPRQVAAYIRWSTEEQADGTTLEVQTEACRHYILAQGWEWRPELVFVDDGYSGGSLDRPGLGRLREAVREGRVSCVVVFKLDRLSRNVVDTVNLVLEEWEGVCYVKSTREPVDTTTPAGKMFFYMLASYAEWERSVIRERTMSGKIRRAQQGRNPGFTPPYGYRAGPGPGQWQVDPTEAAVVRRIFAEYLSGKGIHSIAAMLNSERVPPRRGGRWHVTTIAQMLRQVAYTGVLEYGRTGRAPRRSGHTRVRYTEPRFARVEGALPPLIPEDQFQRVQELLLQRGAPGGRRAHGAAYLLSGIARCRCGASLRGDRRSHRDLRYYRCTAARDGGCDGTLVPAEILEQAVVTRVKAALSPAARTAFRDAVRRELNRTLEVAHNQLVRLQEVRKNLAARRRRLDADYDAGELGARIYTRRVEEWEREVALVEQELEGVGRQVARIQAADVDAAAYERLATQVDAWEHLTPEQRKQLLRHALAELRAYRRPAHRSDPGPHPVEVDLTIRCLTTDSAPHPGRTARGSHSEVQAG